MCDYRAVMLGIVIFQVRLVEVSRNEADEQVQRNQPVIILAVLKQKMVVNDQDIQSNLC